VSLWTLQGFVIAIFLSTSESCVSNLTTNIWSPIDLYCVNCTKFGQLILRKIIKIVATRCHILLLKCTKFDFGLCPRPRWESLQCSPDPLAGFKEDYSYRGGRGRKGKREEAGKMKVGEKGEKEKGRREKGKKGMGNEKKEEGKRGHSSDVAEEAFCLESAPAQQH